MHKSIGVLVLLAATIAVVGCSTSNSNSTSVNGNWSASLTNSQSGQTNYAFTTTLTEANGGGVTVTNFKFTSAGSCFVDGQTSESGNFNGNVTGTFGMTINSTNTNNATLVLQGGVGPNNTLTGTWVLTGSTACSGQGNFTFNKM
ncbi:MAG TPA: hypothetical protein VFE08_09035 [Candidatus Sulfotelmatobacter sp.]|nr:hypothetical protein [Candidatus Sulfotelmatobacter sp.]